MTQAAGLTYVWYITNNNNLCQKDSEEQHAVHFLCYEYIERLRCMPKLLHLSTPMHCTLLYHNKSVLCYLLVPTLQEQPFMNTELECLQASLALLPEAVYQKANAIGWK